MPKAEKDSLSSFPKTSRLVSKQDFQSVFNASHIRKVTQKYFVVLFIPNHLSQSRLGIIVKKQHIRSAVTRNWLRRIIRESFRHQVPPLKGLDIVVLIRSECSAHYKQAGNNALRADIDQLWRAISSKLV